MDNIQETAKAAQSAMRIPRELQGKIRGVAHRVSQEIPEKDWRTLHTYILEAKKIAEEYRVPGLLKRLDRLWQICHPVRVKRMRIPMESEKLEMEEISQEILGILQAAEEHRESQDLREIPKASRKIQEFLGLSEATRKALKDFLLAANELQSLEIPAEVPESRTIQFLLQVPHQQAMDLAYAHLLEHSNELETLLPELVEHEKKVPKE